MSDLNPNAFEWRPTTTTTTTMAPMTITPTAVVDDDDLPSLSALQAQFDGGDTPSTQLQMLQRIFPEHSSASLASALHTHNNDLMLCVERFLALSNDTDEQQMKMHATEATESSAGSTPAPAASTPVCKYFLAGSCLITNCQFLHSRTDRSALCRFWLRGSCMRGDECNFLHELDSVTAAPAPPPQPQPQPRPRPAPPQQHSQLSATASTNPIVNRGRLENLQRKWPNVNRQIIESIFRMSDNVPLRADQMLRARFGGPSVVLAPVSAAPLKAPPSLPLDRSRRVASGGGGGSGSTSTIVSSGARVSSLYLQSRRAAEDHARRRNAYFRQAAAAYLAGDSRLAKELSQKGRYHQQQMNQLHGDASDQIFESRNQELGHAAANTVDVHGLHANEAVDRLHRCLAQIGRSAQHLDIITGVGRHSWQGVSKVRPAVQQYLTQQGLDFEELAVAGTFRVYL